MTSDEFFHLDLVLEVNGLAVRDTWQVNAEQELETARRPDLAVGKLGRRFLIEITIQGKSRSFRTSEQFSDSLSAISFGAEREYGVTTHTAASDVVSESQVADWQRELDRSAALVAADGVSREIEVNGIKTSMFLKVIAPDARTRALWSRRMLGGDSRFVFWIRRSKRQVAHMPG